MATSGNDTLSGTSGANTIDGLGGNDSISGLAGHDSLLGGAGNDTLDGGTGNDTLKGGSGNDTYVVNSLNDVLTEVDGVGVDLVKSSVSWTLGSFFEKLTLTGTAAIKATGNTLDNTLVGNDAANTLDGKGGADTMKGGDGNDSYVVNNAGDVVTELAGNGNDLVKSSVDYTLTANVEKLTLTGTAAIDGTGNGSNNTLTGNSGANQLMGMGGDDTLVYDATDTLVDGGAGTDTLKLTGSDSLDLTGSASGPLSGFERIDLAGSNALIVSGSRIVNLSDTTDTLLVKGGTGDSVTADGLWENAGAVVIDTVNYTEYQQGGAVLRVQDGVDVSGVVEATLEVALSALDGADGFRLSGAAAGDRAGFAVSAAGDVNGDGFGDVIVGAYQASPNGSSSGASYVVFGKNGGFAAGIELSALTGADGFRLSGATESDLAGTAVSAAGDVNGDGFDDIIIGADGAGASYVVFGKSGAFAANVELSALTGSNGFSLAGATYVDAGRSVSEAGDVNGDGVGDIIVGAYGASYVVFGTNGGFAASADLSALTGADGFRLSAAAGGDNSGCSVSAAGDVNGDGYGDIIVGASDADPNGYSSGASFVVFGKAGGFASSIELSALTGSDGFRLAGAQGGDNSGRSVSAAGDVNGDGFGDIIVGAYRAAPNGSDSGAAYVVFGKSGGFGASIELSALTGAGGFRLSGGYGNDYAGHSVSAAGDVNGDGFGDIIVGAWRADSNGINSGTSYLVFGKNGGFAANVELSALSGADGFRFAGAAALDVAGFVVSAAGDVNGDGFDDLLIGAYAADPHGDDTGASYVVFGANFTGDARLAGYGQFLGGAGADTLAGDGGADAFAAGAGDDRIEAADLAFFRVDGGNGSDTLALTGGGLTLDLGALDANALRGIEAIDLTGAGNNVLDLDALGLLNLSGTSNTLTVHGNAGDIVRADGVWTHGENVEIDGQTYAQYVDGAATLRVDLDVNRGGITVRNLLLGGLNGTNGFRLDGVLAGDHAGASVASAGDVNGDGFDDLIVGARYVDIGGYEKAGMSYVVFGKASGYTSPVNLSTLDGTNGFRLEGFPLDGSLGYSVAGAGDLNGDGFDDVVVGIRYGNFVGESYVVFGKAAGFVASLPLSALDGNNGFRLIGDATTGESIRSVASAGDLNADGFGDLVIGSLEATAAGGSFVVFGKASGFDATIDLAGLNGTNGFRVDGVDANDSAGRSVSAGDVNGDGYDDLIIGAPSATVGADAGAGESYVVFGKAGGFTSSIALATLDGTSGFRLDGIDANDYSGRSLSSAGDVNGDGIEDILIGAYGGDPGGDTDAGESYVVFGKAAGHASSIDLATLDGTNGFRLDGIDTNDPDIVADNPDNAGRFVAAAGDVNGDGFDDVIIGARYADPGDGSDSGESYIVFGKAAGFASSIDLAALDGGFGFRLDGEYGSQSARAVAAGGDVNGDGFDDVIIGSPFVSPGGRAAAGESWVVFGRDFRDEVDFLGTAGANTLVGTSAAEIFVAGRGADTMTGGGGADAFRGGRANDVIEVPDTSFLRVDGGAGTDTLRLDGSGVAINLYAIQSETIRGIEAIDLHDGGNVLNMSVRDLLDLSDTSNKLVVDGGASDAVAVNGTWADDGTGVVSGYHQYTLGAATLLINVAITDVSISAVS